MTLRKILPTESLQAVLKFMEVEDIVEVPHSMYPHRSTAVMASAAAGKTFRIVQVNDSTLVIRLN